MKSKETNKEKEHSVCFCVRCQHRTHLANSRPRCCEKGWICWRHREPLVPKLRLNVHVVESLVSTPGSGQTFSLNWTETFLSSLSEFREHLSQKRRSWKSLLMRMKGAKVHPILFSSENGNSILTCLKNPIHHRESQGNGRRGGRWVKTPHIHRPEAFQESCCFVSNTRSGFNQASELTC